MPTRWGSDPRCKRCEYELVGGEDTCPQCQFSPRNRGLRVSLVFLLGMVVAVTVMMFLPRFGRPLIAVAAVSFVLSFLTLLFSFAATPHRFGRLFLLADREDFSRNNS